MAEHSNEQHSNKLYYMIWGGLLFLTLVEIVLGYIQLNLATMLFTLLALSIIKAGMIVAYFMHLKFERMSLVLTLIPMTLICIALFAIFFPDSMRLGKIGTNFDNAAAYGEKAEAGQKESGAESK